MKQWPLSTVSVELESEVVYARRLTRRIAELLGYELQDRTRIATAVSEIARNAQVYGKLGRTEFSLQGRETPEFLVIRVTDKGAGLPASVAADKESGAKLGLGLGLPGARRLMDEFEIRSAPGDGTTVCLRKLLPQGSAISPEKLGEIARRLREDAPTNAISELRSQNAELMQNLEIMESRRIEAQSLAEELERTNKGVVALYAELDRRAVELQQLNETLEQRVADGVAERARVEERLRQSQKMEAVGQLTGGIAHDFNNILMIVGGSLSMLRRRVGSDPKILRLLEAASDGVERGSSINKQLLAFARRQDLAVENVKASNLMSSLIGLIKRAISEDIELLVDCTKDLWVTRTDPHQLEVAILNLAINARDSMPDGGCLKLAAYNEIVTSAFAQKWEADEGEYVAISISDTGYGMTSDVLKRVFEPFFTTKEVGRGTGLGLSQVYGFARQSGGFVSIESKLGEGTTVRVFLPRTLLAADASGLITSTSVRHGTAKILVVEDASSRGIPAGRHS